MPSCGEFWDKKKTIIPLLASVRTKFNRMFTIVYDDDMCMCIAIGFTQLTSSAALKKAVGSMQTLTLDTVDALKLGDPIASLAFTSPRVCKIDEVKIQGKL